MNFLRGLKQWLEYQLYRWRVWRQHRINRKNDPDIYPIS